MSIGFKELDYQQTALGDLILRRRRIESLDGLEVFEIKLGDSFLMSSLFTKAEVALSELALAELNHEPALDVIVGGLGLGYTARAALAQPRVRSVTVIEALAPVIQWHRDGLVPLGAALAADQRCEFIHGDFFELAKSGFRREHPEMLFHTILLDIDHSPDDLLDPRNGAFYGVDALRQLQQFIHPGGVFGMWSDEPPDDRFMAVLAEAFDAARAHIVHFHNPLLDEASASTVYVATKTR